MPDGPLDSVSTVGDAAAQSPAAAVVGLEFFDDFWVNLHHVLYAAAWAARDRPGWRHAGRLPTPLAAPLTAAEERRWQAALQYYEDEWADRDLLFDPAMRSVNRALAYGDREAMRTPAQDDAKPVPACAQGSAQPLPAPLRAALESVAPIYRRDYWPEHSALNRRWTDDTVAKLATVAERAVPRLENLYGCPWPAAPVRVDVVWVGGFGGGYTTDEPPHVTVASADRQIQGWGAVEVLLHEVSHLLVRGMHDEIAAALGDQAADHPRLWHVVLFHLTGTAVAEELSAGGVDYIPYLYRTGLIDRAWPHYRDAVRNAWAPYLAGSCGRPEAINHMVDSLGSARRP